MKLFTQIDCRFTKRASSAEQIAEVARGISYEEFLRKLDSGFYDVLYRGHSGDGKTKNIFATDYHEHAKAYGDTVDGYVYNPQDGIFFNDAVFDDLRRTYGRISMRDLAKIYGEAFSEDRLADAMYGEEERHTERSVLRKVMKILRGDEKFGNMSQDKYTTDLLVPIMQHYATSKGKNVIGFIGGDYWGEGQAEFVIADASGMPRILDIWKSVNADGYSDAAKKEGEQP
jgi:hypothetical protein